MDDRVAHMDEHLRRWSRQTSSRMPHSGGFVKERIGLTSYQVCPDACWSKHADTYVYHLFMEWLLTCFEQTCQSHDILSRMLEAIRSINEAFRLLYRGGLWLDCVEANRIGTLGRRWLQLHAELSMITFNAGRLRFPLFVKHHMLDHHFRQLLHSSSLNRWTYNVLAESVQMDEDPWLKTRVNCKAHHQS